MSRDGFGLWSHAGVELRRVRDTLALIDPAGIGSILDYGCGRGDWSGTLRARFPAARITGIDISATAIRKAREAMPDQEFRPFDGARAPYAAGAFDLLFSYHVLEHVLDIDAVVSDMSRLVRPGGWLCIIFPCANPGSLEANLASSVVEGVEAGVAGEPRFYFEDAAHLRRMRSDDVIRMFNRNNAVLQNGWFAHQFFGAVEWITSSGRGFAGTLFAGRRATGPGAALRLALLRLTLMPLAMLRDLATVDLARPRSRFRRAALYAVRPMRWLGAVVSKGLESLAGLEWRYGRRRPNGSAQFLVFRKRTEPR